MGRLSALVIDAWRRTPLCRHPRITGIERVPDRAHVPDPLPRRRVLVVGTPPKWALLACPCGAGHVVHLNLANTGAPRWRVAGDEEPSVSPSIDVRDTVRCHFWVRRGRVDWVQRRHRGVPRAPRRHLCEDG